MTKRKTSSSKKKGLIAGFVAMVAAYLAAALVRRTSK